MRVPMAFRLLLALALLVSTGSPSHGQTPAPAPTGDQVAVFLERVRDLALKGDGPALTALAASGNAHRGLCPHHDAGSHRAGHQGTRPGGAAGRRHPAAAGDVQHAGGGSPRVHVADGRHGQRGQSRHVAHHAARSAVDRIRAVQAVARSRAAVRGSQPEPQGSRSLGAACRRHGLRRLLARRPDRGRSPGPRAPAVLARRPVGAHPARDFLRGRTARRRVRRRHDPHPPDRLRRRLPRRHAHGASRRSGGREARGVVLRRVHRQDPQRRPERSEPRSLVAGAAGRGSDRRNPHQAVRQPDLRAQPVGSRRRLVLRSPAQEEHRDLRLRREARHPRQPLLQRGRQPRLRRHQLRPRGGLQSRAVVDRRQDEGVADGDARR